MRQFVIPIVMAVVAVAMLIVFAGLVVFAFDDATDKAPESKGFGGIPANPIEIKESQSLYRRANFERALAAIRKKEGAAPQLLALNVMPWMADFRVGVGEGLHGYRYYAKDGTLSPYKEKISGTDSIEPKKFPMATVQPGVTERLAAGVRERVRDAKVSNMSIDRDIINRKLSWSVVAESDTRTGIVFRARPDGSGMADPTTYARRENPVFNAPPGLPPDVRRKVRCVQRAHGDTAKLQRCSRL